jgi:hypothetical protein
VLEELRSGEVSGPQDAEDLDDEILFGVCLGLEEWKERPQAGVPYSPYSAHARTPQFQRFSLVSCHTQKRVRELRREQASAISIAACGRRSSSSVRDAGP